MQVKKKTPIHIPQTNRNSKPNLSKTPTFLIYTSTTMQYSWVQQNHYNVSAQESYCSILITITKHKNVPLYHIVKIHSFLGIQYSIHSVVWLLVSFYVIDWWMWCIVLMDTCCIWSIMIKVRYMVIAICLILFKGLCIRLCMKMGILRERLR